jgi:hypothetical protein
VELLVLVFVVVFGSPFVGGCNQAADNSTYKFVDEYHKDDFDSLKSLLNDPEFEWVKNGEIKEKETVKKWKNYLGTKKSEIIKSFENKDYSIVPRLFDSFGTNEEKDRSATVAACYEEVGIFTNNPLVLSIAGKMFEDLYHSHNNEYRRSNYRGFQYFKSKYGRKAIQLYRMAAESEEPFTKRILAGCYLYGFYDTKQDKTKAFQLYAEAAEQGDATGQYVLGILYENGINVPKDRQKALELYKNAVENGYSNAMFELECIGLRKGKSTPQEWYQDLDDFSKEVFQKKTFEGLVYCLVDI